MRVGREQLPRTLLEGLVSSGAVVFHNRSIDPYCFMVWNVNPTSMKRRSRNAMHHLSALVRTIVRVHIAERIAAKVRVPDGLRRPIPEEDRRFRLLRPTRASRWKGSSTPNTMAFSSADVMDAR
jgi:hypothetical protein